MDALTFFLTNLLLQNLVLALVCFGLGLWLGALLWRKKSTKDIVEAKLAAKEADRSSDELFVENERLKKKLAETQSYTPPKEALSEATASTSSAAKKTDLTLVKGIGKASAAKLIKTGITSLEDLAGLTDEELKRLDATLKFSGRMLREDWANRARALIED